MRNCRYTIQASLPATLLLIVAALTTKPLIEKCVAQAKQRLVIPGGPYYYSGVTSDGWGWAAMGWNADNRPYASIRQRIESDISSSSDPRSIVRDYRAKALANAADPEAEFSYGYADWYLSSIQTLPWPINTDAADRLAVAKFPNTFDYARLRFLVQMDVHYVPELIPVGLRLSRLVPLDEAIRGKYIDSLAYSRTTANTLLAFEALDASIKDDPNNPLPFGRRGMLNIDLYSRTHDISFQKKGIADLQTYEKLAPSTWTRKPMFEAVINSELKSH